MVVVGRAPALNGLRSCGGGRYNRLKMSPEDSTWEEPIRVRLKVFLAYAWGVGKSSRMFDEGRRRRERGQDVVAGALQPKVPEAASTL